MTSLTLQCTVQSRRAPDIVIHVGGAEERPFPSTDPAGSVEPAAVFSKKGKPSIQTAADDRRSQMEQCSGKGASNRPRRRSSKDLVRKLRELTESPGGTAGYSKTELLAWLREFTGLPVGSIEGLRDGVALSRAVALAHEISDVKSPLKRISARDSAEQRVN